MVRDAVRARRDHRLVPVAVRPPAGRRRDPRGPRSPAGGTRGPEPRCRARQDPPRAAHGRDGAHRRAAVPAVLRVRGRHAAVADPVCRDLRLDRRPGPRRPAVAQRAASARLDRPLRRPGWRRVRRVRAARAVGPGQPGLEGLERRASATGTASWRARPIALAEVQGYVFDAKVRMAAPCPRPRRRRPRDHASRREAETLRQRFEAAFWSDDQAFYVMALDGEKRQADAIASNAGHCLWSGIASPDRAKRVVDRLMAPDMFSGWGIRTYAAGQPGYNPIGYHSGLGLAARRVADRRRLQALRPVRGGEPPGRPDLRGRPALRRLPAAGAVLRLRPRPLADPGPVPGRLLAAGLGRGLDVPVPRDDARVSGRTPTVASSSSSARSSPTGCRR